jgi:HD-GYP domain-containing protein (c-di-GMP phosphodiesterase class II)
MAQTPVLRLTREDLSSNEVCTIIRGMDGKQLDPQVVRAFLDGNEEFSTVS